MIDSSATSYLPAGNHKAPENNLRVPAEAKILSPGANAPNFTLHVTPDQTLSLQALRGRPVILAFYPADWSAVLR